MNSIREFLIQKYAQTSFNDRLDTLAVEEPLEISIQYTDQGEKKRQSISITMRTPGHDAELSAGFLYTEGILTDREQIEKISSFTDNQVTIHIQENVAIDIEKLKRNFYTTSSCGVCGKSSIDAIRTIIAGHTMPPLHLKNIDPKLVLSLKDKINTYQSNFSQTGGIHASALFNLDGDLISIFEDVGRHNALDKLIGHHFLNNQLNFKDKVLLLSGRASFELIQKSIMAQIQTICAIGAPSSLAVDLAKEFNITLIGFLKNDSFNIYNS